MGKRLLTYVPALLVAGVIFYLSLLHAPHLRLEVSNGDKWGHMCAYFVLAICLFWPLWRDKASGWKTCLLTLLLPAFYGGLMEILQGLYFPPRTAEWGDWFADVIGAVLAYLLSLLICRIISKSDAR